MAAVYGVVPAAAIVPILPAVVAQTGTIEGPIL